MINFSVLIISAVFLFVVVNGQGQAAACSQNQTDTANACYSTFTTCRDATANPTANYPDAAACKCYAEYPTCLEAVTACGNYETVRQERIAGLCTGGCTCAQCNKANEDKFGVCESTLEKCTTDAASDTTKACLCMSAFFQCVDSTLPADFAAKCLEGRVTRSVADATATCKQKNCVSCAVETTAVTTSQATTAAAGSSTANLSDTDGDDSAASIATVATTAIVIALVNMG